MHLKKYPFTKQLINLLVLLLFNACHTEYPEPSETPAQKNLLLYCGSAARPPVEEIVSLFESQYKIKTTVIYGGSGYLLAQMKLSKKGDIYFPGSSDFMEKAKYTGEVFPETEQKIVYMLPAICVPKNNPENIQSLKDLSRPGMKLAIGNPEYVCIGTYAVEIIEHALSNPEKIQLKKNIVAYTESCEKTATLISLKSVDAIIGWDIFEHQDSVRIKCIKLKSPEIIRISYLSAAVSKYTHDKSTALLFINFLKSKDAYRIFQKYHYYITPEDIFNSTDADGHLIGKKPVGGTYKLPDHWIIK